MKTCRKIFIIYNSSIMSIIQKSQKALEYDKILAELSKFAKIYGWTMEELLEGNKEEKMAMPMFARTFNELSKEDQDEIINLIKFKKMYKDKKISE